VALEGIDTSELKALEAWKDEKIQALQPVTNEKLADMAAVLAEYKERMDQSTVAGALRQAHAEAALRRAKALQDLAGSWRAALAERPECPDCQALIRAVVLRAVGRVGGVVGSEPALSRTLGAFLRALDSGGNAPCAWVSAAHPQVVDADLGLWEMSGPSAESVSRAEADKEAAVWALLGIRGKEQNRDSRQVKPTLIEAEEDGTKGRLANASRRIVEIEHRVIAELGRQIAASESSESLGAAFRRQWLGEFAKIAVPSFAGEQWLEEDGAQVALGIAGRSPDKDARAASVQAALEKYKDELGACRESLSVKAMLLLEERTEFGFKGGKAQRLENEMSDSAWKIQRDALERICGILGGDLAREFRGAVDRERQARPFLFEATIGRRRLPPPRGDRAQNPG